MVKKQTNEHGNGAVVAGILGVAAAAAAGAYFLYGTKDGKKMKKQIRGWALKAKGEVLEKVEKLKEVNEEAYHQVIDAVLKRYKTIKGIDTVELAAIASELKGHWANIRKELDAGAKKMVKAKNLASKAKTNGTKKSAK
jgi:hypothetical protein